MVVDGKNIWGVGAAPCALPQSMVLPVPEAGVRAACTLGMAVPDESSAFTKCPQIKSVCRCGN